MGADCYERGGRHPEHSAEFVETLERSAGRTVIEPRRTIFRKDRVLRPGRRCGADPFADRDCQTMRAFGIAAGDTQQRFEERRRSRTWIDPRGLVFDPHHDAAGAGWELASDTVHWPATVRSRIRQVEDDLKNRPVSGGLCNGVS